MKVVRELYLDLPSGKPPFIGVLYSIDNGATENSQIFKSDVSINIHVYPHKYNMRIHVFVDKSSTYYTYYVLYDMENFMNWVIKARDANLINFGHVVKTLSKAKLAEFDKKPLFKKVERLLIIHYDNLKTIQAAF